MIRGSFGLLQERLLEGVGGGPEKVAITRQDFTDLERHDIRAVKRYGRFDSFANLLIRRARNHQMQVEWLVSRHVFDSHKDRLDRAEDHQPGDPHSAKLFQQILDTMMVAQTAEGSTVAGSDLPALDADGDEAPRTTMKPLPLEEVEQPDTQAPHADCAKA